MRVPEIARFAPMTDLPRTNSISEGVRPPSFSAVKVNNVRFGSIAE